MLNQPQTAKQVLVLLLLLPPAAIQKAVAASSKHKGSKILQQLDVIVFRLLSQGYQGGWDGSAICCPLHMWQLKNLNGKEQVCGFSKPFFLILACCDVSKFLPWKPAHAQQSPFQCQTVVFATSAAICKPDLALKSARCAGPLTVTYCVTWADASRSYLWHRYSLDAWCLRLSSFAACHVPIGSSRLFLILLVVWSLADFFHKAVWTCLAVRGFKR